MPRTASDILDDANGDRGSHWQDQDENTTAQNLSPNISALSSLDGSENKLAYFTAAGAMALCDLTAFARTMMGDVGAEEARGTIGLGTAATADVTTSPGDATAGRVLRVGDSAWLLSASPSMRMQLGGSADAITLTTGAGITGTPPAGLRLRFRAGAANTGAATIALDGGAAIDCRTITGVALPAGYIRTDTDTEATFDGTYWVLDRKLERGSNANGLYTRYPDGSQVCIGKNLLSAAVTTAYGSIYANSAEQFWTFPAAFITAVDAACTVSVLANARWGGARVTSPTAAGVRQYAASSLVSSVGCDLVANGYWY